MSAGALFGTAMNMILFAGFWTVIGVVFDRVAVVFNSTIRLMPTMQDAVNGFALTQIIYGILPIIVIAALAINYVLVENNNQSGLV